MEHSAAFYKIKKWYKMNMWDEPRVRNAVTSTTALCITAAEYEEITGLPY